MGHQFASTYVFCIPASLSFRNFSAFLFKSPHYEALLYVIFFIILLLPLLHVVFQDVLCVLLLVVLCVLL